MLLLIFTIQSNKFTSHVFFYNQAETFGNQLIELPSESCLILIVKNKWNISDFSIPLQNASYVYAIDRDNIQQGLPESLFILPETASLQSTYLLFSETDYGNTENEQTDSISVFNNLPYVDKMLLIGKDIVNGRSVLIYSLE